MKTMADCKLILGRNRKYKYQVLRRHLELELGKLMRGPC